MENVSFYCKLLGTKKEGKNSFIFLNLYLFEGNKANIFSLIYTPSLLHAKRTTKRYSWTPLGSLSPHCVAKKKRHNTQERKKKEKKTLRFHTSFNAAFGFFASSFALKASRCALDSGESSVLSSLPAPAPDPETALSIQSRIHAKPLGVLISDERVLQDGAREVGALEAAAASTEAAFEAKEDADALRAAAALRACFDCFCWMSDEKREGGGREG